MSIEEQLAKDGITVISALDESSAISIAKNVTKRIYSSFANYGFTFRGLFEKLSNVKMYIADIPSGLSEASYFYKNQSIYFRDGMGLSDIEKYSVHEFIHCIQERKDESGNLIRLGLSEYKNGKPIGTALNEGAVQILASNILNNNFETVEYYGLTFSTISPELYPLICNLVTQMGSITGEELLFDSTFNSNDRFKNRFIALCGRKNYNKILKNLDNLLKYEEDIILLNNILQNQELSMSKSTKIMEKVDKKKALIRQTYFTTQELIISSYFNTLYSNLFTTDDISSFRKNLYSFQELIGTTPDYHFFNNFYISMMEKLDIKFDVLSNSTYLVERKENKFTHIINYIKVLLFNHQYSKEKEK